MNLEDLRAAQTRERATDGLQELRDSFYADVAAYIADLKERRETAAAAAEDPFGDPEVQELSDKIETAEQVTEAIYERRMGKLVKQASLAAAGMPDDANGLTDEERALYGDLVDRIQANKNHVLDVISGDADAGGDDLSSGTQDAPPGSAESAADQSSTGTPAESAGGDASPGTGDADEASAAAAMGGGLDDADTAAESPDAGGSTPPSEDSGADPTAGETAPSETIANDLAELKDEDGGAGGDGGADGKTGESTDGGQPQRGSGATGGEATDDSDGGADVDRTMVRVTDDVGAIFGMDEREYTLEADDVVTLPTENAEPLVEKGAAEKLE